MPLPIARAQQAARQAQRNPHNQAGQAAERMVYSPEVHGDANAFRNSAQFSTFTSQYKAELKQLSDVVDEHVTEPVKAHQLKRNLASFEDHLFGNADHFSTLSGMVFKGGREDIQQITERLASPNISALDKLTGLERALGEIDKCAKGLLSNLGAANLHLKCAEEGKTGACNKKIHQQIEAHALAFAKRNHGKERNYAGNEVHFTNAYMDRAIKDHFKQLPTSGDNLDAYLERQKPYLLVAFSDQIPSSITPGSIITGLADEHYQAFSGVLSEHTQSSNKVLKYEEITPDFIRAVDQDVLTPLKPLLTDEQRGTICYPQLGEDVDGESFSFEGSKEKIRTLIATSMKDGLLELGWSSPSQRVDEKIVDIKGGLSIHHEQGVLFSVKSSGSEEPRRPRITDLKSLELTGWPSSLMSDLAQQVIGTATSVKELSDFTSQHLTYPPISISTRERNVYKGLQSTLTQAVQVKAATDPTIQNELVSRIGEAGSAKGLESLRPLIAMSTQAKVAYVNKAHALELPITDTVRSYLCDMDILSEAPVAQIVQAFVPDKLHEMLHKTAFKGHENGVAKLTSISVIDINHQHSNGNTPLVLACSKGHVAVVKKLLEHQDIDINKPGHRGGLPLSFASANGHVAVMETLLKHQKIEVNKADDNGNTPINLASRYGQTAAVEALLKQDGIDANKVNEYDMTPLNNASKQGHTAVVEKLIDNHRVDLNKPDEYGMTPLNNASNFGHATVVEKLLKRDNIDVNKPDAYGMTPLNSASNQGHATTVEKLLKDQDVDINRPDNDGKTPLNSASTNGHTAVVEKLLKVEGIDVNATDGDRSTALIRASNNGHAVVVEKLLEDQNIEVNTPNGDGFTPLILASTAGHVTVLEKLLEHPDIDVNKHDGARFTPLTHASNQGEKVVVEKLLEHPDINVNKADSLGRTPLIYASHRGHSAAVGELLKHTDIDVNKADSINKTPLDYAYAKGQMAVLEQLIAHPSVDINRADENGKTLLHHVCTNNHVTVLNRLLKHPDIDVNKSDMNGKTPLDHARDNGHVSALTLLERFLESEEARRS